MLNSAACGIIGCITLLNHSQQKQPQLISAQTSQTRKDQLTRWVFSVLTNTANHTNHNPLQSVGGDAGFRHYYRIATPEGTAVAVDAPPETEDTQAFVRIANAWRQGGVRVPEVRAVDYDQGFMLQEDFGDTPLQWLLNEQTADHYYQQAFATLKVIQQQSPDILPAYDRQLLMFELSLYPEWFLTQFLELDQPLPDLNDLFSQLVSDIQQQPTGTVHRDYHSRNLMVLANGSLGVIDFQGALNGPLLYDTVSLLKDCYVRWPDDRVNSWLRAFSGGHPLFASYSFEQIRTWFDLTGLQRHLKCLGIFARLWLRDGKSGYLKDIPRTFDYVLEVCQRYPQLQAHHQWLTEHVQPVLATRLKAVQAEADAL